LIFHKMMAGFVHCVDQREHLQREFLAMMSSTDGTIENWPRSLREYPMPSRQEARKTQIPPPLWKRWMANMVRNIWKQRGWKWKPCKELPLGMEPSTKRDQCIAIDLGVQAQAISRWATMEIQGATVCARWQANQRHWSMPQWLTGHWLGPWWS